MNNVVEKFKNGRNIQLNKFSGIRKMQTTAGGPIRKTRLTPEQIAEIEKKLNYVPGMNINSNNTVGESAKRAGEAAVRLTNIRNAEEAEAFNRRNEMRSRVPVGERSGEIIYETQETGPKVIGMSGRDPLLGTLFDFYVGGKGLEAIGKTGLWNIAKYAPKTLLGNWGRGYFINNEMKMINPIRLTSLIPTIRTKIGDVEIDNPQLAYRLGSRELGEDFSRTGIVSTDGEGFTNPMFALGRLWYGVPTDRMLLLGKGILFKTSSGRTFNLTKRNEEAPKTDLLVSNAEMSPANLHSTPLKWITTIDGKTSVLNWGDRRVPTTQATSENTTRYIFKPGYGYKKVTNEPSTSLKFFERKPSKLSLAERVGVPKGERVIWNPEVMKNAKLFAEKYGYEIPENILQAKNIYRQHNRMFRTVNIEPFEINPELYPDLSGMTHELIIKTLASKGYPTSYRSYNYTDRGFSDDMVFTSPSLGKNTQYNGGDLSNTVMLQRPFSFGKPELWHINADWRPKGKLNYGQHKKGDVSEGNSPYYDEMKVATEYLIPVKIAERSDKGTLLGDYLAEHIFSLKQGGMLELLKKGSKIHIKEKNKGTFTRWCGGNVTDECILRGKNSSNPKIRKKATFADNARHFKHKKGGKAFVEGVNVLDSNPKMSKAASRRVKKHLYGGDINNPNAMGGTAFTSWMNYLMRLPELLKLKEERKQQELLLEQQKLIEKSKKLNSILGTVSDFGYLALGKLLNKKSTNKIDNGTPSTTNFWDTPTIKNSQVIGDFWNNPTIANSIA